MRTLRFCTSWQGLAAISLLLAAALFSSHRVAAQSGQERLSLPQDWSHQHVVFSRTQEIPLVLKLRQDPRLLHQWLKYNAPKLNPGNLRAIQQTPDQLQFEDRSSTSGRNPAQKEVDWSVSLGGAASFVPRSQFPAKYSFDLAAPPDCANDFVVFPTSRPGSGTQATIVAFNNLYSGQGTTAGICGNAGPSVKWAYNTGSQVMSSPVISLDGTKVAFVSRIPGTVHVLKVGTTGNNGTSPTAPVVPGAANNAVDVRIALNGGHRVSFSSLFVEYRNDVGYVGDDAGILHKITGVFTGTPTEVTTGGWPIHTVSAAALSAPVFDFTGSGNIFITDQSGNLSYVRETGSTTGTCEISGPPPCLGFPVVAVGSGGSSSFDAPIADSATGRVFTETAANGGNAQIVQTDAALGNVVRANVGLQDAAHPLHNGYFDENYLNGVAPGFYYACGKASSGTVLPTLYRIGFNGAGVMNSAPDAPTLPLARTVAGTGQCSPITQFVNGKQWLFVSVSTRCGATAAIGGGCIMAIDITNGMPASLAGTPAVLERNGTSGIIIDNVSTAAQASSIYFSNQGTGACGDGIATGGCAVKLTQSGLK